MNEFTKVKDPLCFICSKQIESWHSELCHFSNNPGNYCPGGTHFTSTGNYGSTVYDPMDGHKIHIIVCDDCFKQNLNRIYEKS
jgi:hypothetical protein